MGTWKDRHFNPATLPGTPFYDPRSVNWISELMQSERRRLGSMLFGRLHPGSPQSGAQHVIFQGHPDAVPTQGPKPQLVVTFDSMTRSPILNQDFEVLNIPFDSDGDGQNDKAVTIRKPRLYDLKLRLTLWEWDEYPPGELVSRLTTALDPYVGTVLGQMIRARIDTPITPIWRPLDGACLMSQGVVWYDGVPVWFTPAGYDPSAIPDPRPTPTNIPAVANGEVWVGGLIREALLQVRDKRVYDATGLEEDIR